MLSASKVDLGFIGHPVGPEVLLSELLLGREVLVQLLDGPRELSAPPRKELLST